MANILLANIGNRNIRYTGNSPVSLYSTSFRQDTKFLLDHFEQEKEHITPQILPELIDSLSETPQKIFLFGSNQTESGKNNQDTLYEAEILTLLFRERYPESTIEAVICSCSVVDVNDLMRFYRSFINELVTEHPESKIILCDAGGTSQQKSALKIISEYLLSDDQYELYNVALVAGNSIPERIQSVEYRRVIDAQQIELLINQFDYSGALSIYFGNRKQHTDNISALLKIGAALFNNNADSASQLAKSAPKALKVQDLLKGLAQEKHYTVALEEWTGILERGAVFRLCIILDIAQAYKKIQDWGFALLYHHIFEERFLHEVLKKSVAPYSLTDDWNKIKEEIQADRKFAGVTMLGGRSLSQVYSATVPVLRDLARTLFLPQVDDVVNRISDDHQKQFSTWRNKFAHEGRTIHASDVRAYLPVFQDWRSMFGLSDETVFDELNAVIIKYVRQ